MMNTSSLAPVDVLDELDEDLLLEDEDGDVLDEPWDDDLG